MKILEKIFGNGSNKKQVENQVTAEEQHGEEFDLQVLKDRLLVKAGWLEKAEREGSAEEKAEILKEMEEIERQLLGLGVSEEEIETMAGRELKVAA